MKIEFNGEELINLVIGWGHDNNGFFCALISDIVVDLNFSGGISTQCFPLFLYEELENDKH